MPKLMKKLKVFGWLFYFFKAFYRYGRSNSPSYCNLWVWPLNIGKSFLTIPIVWKNSFNNANWELSALHSAKLYKVSNLYFVGHKPIVVKFSGKSRKNISRKAFWWKFLTILLGYGTIYCVMDSYWFLITKITQPNPKNPLIKEIGNAEKQENMENDTAERKFWRKKRKKSGKNRDLDGNRTIGEA